MNSCLLLGSNHWDGFDTRPQENNKSLDAELFFLHYCAENSVHGGWELETLILRRFVDPFALQYGLVCKKENVPIWSCSLKGLWFIFSNWVMIFGTRDEAFSQDQSDQCLCIVYESLDTLDIWIWFRGGGLLPFTSHLATPQDNLVPRSLTKQVEIDKYHFSSKENVHWVKCHVKFS